MRDHYLVWPEDEYSGPDEDGELDVDRRNIVKSASSSGEAAERYLESTFSDHDYPSEMDVVVHAPDGSISRHTVTVETVPLFHARPKP